MTIFKRLKNVFERFFENPTASNYSVLSLPLFFPFLADFSRDGLIVTARGKNTTCRSGVGRGNWRNGASKTLRYDWNPKNQIEKKI